MFDLWLMIFTMLRQDSDRLADSASSKNLLSGCECITSWNIEIGNQLQRYYHFISCRHPVLGHPGKGVNRLYCEASKCAFRPSRDFFFLPRNPRQRHRWTAGAFAARSFLHCSVTASESTYVRAWHARRLARLLSVSRNCNPVVYARRVHKKNLSVMHLIQTR